MKILYTLLILLVLSSCRHEKVETQVNDHITTTIRSLNGKELLPPKDPKKIALEKDKNLRKAQLDYNNYPDSVEAHIWYGRRLAYVYKYNEAIDVYSKAIQKFPESPELYRHRGHRYITTRNFDKAVSDFQRASELVQNMPLQIEPDGIPNAINKPLSNLQFNIWYHWGLTYFFIGDYENAKLKLEACLAYSDNPDLIVANADWLYMTYMKLDQQNEARAILDKVNMDMIMIENDSYFKRIMMYKGIFKAEDLIDPSKNKTASSIELMTQGFGVAQYHSQNKEEALANQIYRNILKSNYWNTFGYIGAESEMNEN